MPDAVIAAGIGLCGAIIGSLLTSLVQWNSARLVQEAETARLKLKLDSEFRASQYSAWEQGIREQLAQLLSLTDPESNKSFEPNKINPLVHSLQLMLSDHVGEQKAVAERITGLVMAVNGWRGEKSMQEIFSLHGAVVDAAKLIVYNPGSK